MYIYVFFQFIFKEITWSRWGVAIAGDSQCRVSQPLVYAVQPCNVISKAPGFGL